MRVLVVEDEKKVANFIRRGLKEEDYTVDIAHDGQEGESLLVNNEYDLILLDMMLPYISGMELLHKLRQRGVTTPVIILTVKNAVKDKVAGLDAGADDYLTKPFAFEELLARIRTVVRKRSTSAVTRLQVADLEMDLLARKVWRAGREIDLTVREFALLEYLLRNAGTVVTRTMIANHVWDVGFDTFTNIIDVYINFLRNKIDSQSDQKLIHTVRGRGYVLKA